MTFPTEGVRACDELASRYESLARSADDNDRRRLTRMIGEQIASVLGPRWGCKKRAGLGDEYLSKDAIAYLEDDDTVSVWDWQNGGTRMRGVNAGDQPSNPHLPTSEAKFVPVTAHDHLGWQSVPVTPPVIPDQPTGTDIPRPYQVNGDLQSFMEDVRSAIGRMEKRLGSLEHPEPIVFPPAVPETTWTVTLPAPGKTVTFVLRGKKIA